jgi:L-ascorbate metabolism protein UlaG (beta-lactamase superfamily)
VTRLRNGEASGRGPGGRTLVALGAAIAFAGCAAVPLPRRSVYHPSDADLSVTRIVHGAVILEMRGTRVLVDPWFHSGLVVRQQEPLGLTPDGLPPLAAVLLTHRHADHFDERALRALAATVPEAVARPELRERLTELGFRRVTPLEWWERTRIEGIELTAVPARHSAPENGYVLEAGGVRAYVAGDTRYFAELVDVATRFPRPDAALLPVGGARLLGLRREMGPEEAARAAALLDARRVIPIGYGERGGFPLRWHARHPTASFIAECNKRGIAGDRVVVLEPGESWHYYK